MLKKKRKKSPNLIMIIIVKQSRNKTKKTPTKKSLLQVWVRERPEKNKIIVLKKNNLPLKGRKNTENEPL